MSQLPWDPRTRAVPEFCGSSQPPYTVLPTPSPSYSILY